jgi:DNA-binding MarR family transcriptional regulator
MDSPSPPDPVDEAGELRVLLTRLTRQLRARSAVELTPSQASALARLQSCGPMRLGVLADSEGTSAPTASRMVDSLVARNLLAKVTDPEDGRASLIQLTPEGSGLLAQLRERYTLALRAAIDELAPDQRARLRSALPVLDALVDLLHQQAAPKEASAVRSG